MDLEKTFGAWTERSYGRCSEYVGSMEVTECSEEFEQWEQGMFKSRKGGG